VPPPVVVVPPLPPPAVAGGGVAAGETLGNAWVRTTTPTTAKAAMITRRIGPPVMRAVRWEPDA
jgi:hypothetical protein